MDIQNLLRRLQAGQKDRAVARALKVNRATVGKYRTWAEASHLLEGPLPDLETLHALLKGRFGDPDPRQNHSSVEAYRDVIQALVDQGCGPRTVWEKLGEQIGFTGSESSVYRMCAKLKAAQPPDVVVRIETPPGEVAQVDFGEVGKLFDPVRQTIRRAWVFAMVLGWSRHMYAELVFDQTLTTWLLCHQRAFEFFGGVPRRVVIDNLKAAVVRAYVQDQDPEVTRAYGECADHYDFLIDPCLPKHPEHKGKVERGGVRYIQQSFVPLVTPNSPLPEANAQLQHWLLTRAGLRKHGTTHQVPLARFVQTEQKALLPLPTTAYDPAVWKQVKLHRDGHVVFDKAFYSAPWRFVGQTLWLRAGLREIRLFSSDFALVATHPRAARAGERLTHLDHLPREKVRGLTATRPSVQAEAETIGPATAQVVSELLASRPVDKLRTALRVLRLAETYTPARLEAACARGLAFGDVSLPTLKRILVEKLDVLTLPLPIPSSSGPETFVFVRPPEELARAIEGGATWN
jgi:transposase